MTNRYEQLTVGELNAGLPAYTLATVPDAATNQYRMIVITDATPPCLAWSDGTNWIASDDGLTAA